MSKPSLYLGHHKAASTWIQVIMRDAARLMRSPFFIAWSPHQFNHDLSSVIDARTDHVISYSNAEFKYVKPVLSRVHAFHVIRDPRDMIVSAYFSHLKTHPTDLWPDLIQYRDQLNQLCKEEGMLQTIKDMDCLHYWEEPVGVIRSMYDWNYETPEILEMRYESMTTNVLGAWRQITSHLGLVHDSQLSFKRYIIWQTHQFLSGYFRSITRNESIPWWRFLHIIDAHDFSRKASGRSKGTQSTSSHYRKGVGGDWKNHFTPRLKEAFKERYDNILIKLGYEDSNDW